jgi:hypothetical protein
LRVATLQGQVAVTDNSGAASVVAGRQSRFHGSVAAAESERLDRMDALDQWAAERDRREDQSVSTRYVSRDMIGYEDLDNYGTWQVIDEYGPVWRPAVSAGWSPYRNGHWIWVTPWGWTWVDDAPWGFAPFHYGRWVNLRGNWCWSPGPRSAMPYYAPALVGWVGGFSVGVSIGGPPVAWFPLGWNEVYVPSYRSSRHYVENVNITNIHVNNVVVNQYYDRARGDHDERGRGAPQEFRNFGVAGAVVSTTRNAFSTGQPVHAHPADMPRVEHARIDHAAPDMAPTAGSYGRPATITPRQDIFARPIMGAPISVRPGADGARPENRMEPSRSPDYRPPTRLPPAQATTPPTQQDRVDAPRPEWRPGGLQENRPGSAAVPSYRPGSAPNPSMAPAPTVTPENRFSPPRNDWRPGSAPDDRATPAAVPDYRPTPAPRQDYRPAPPIAAPSSPVATPVPEGRYTPPPRPEWQPQPPPAAQAPERRYEAPRTPEYRPAPTPPPSPPPVMRDYRPPAPPAAPPAAPAARRPPPEATDDRRDRPH